MSRACKDVSGFVAGDSTMSGDPHQDHVAGDVSQNGLDPWMPWFFGTDSVYGAS